MAGRAKRTSFPFVERSQQLSSALHHQRANVLKISRAELSRRSGVSASNIQAIEDGRTLDPGLFTVVQLAVAMHLDVSAVMKSLHGPLRTAPLHRTNVDANRTP
jgi:hypothetical protein